MEHFWPRPGHFLELIEVGTLRNFPPETLSFFSFLKTETAIFTVKYFVWVKISLFVMNTVFLISALWLLHYASKTVSVVVLVMNEVSSVRPVGTKLYGLWTPYLSVFVVNSDFKKICECAMSMMLQHGHTGPVYRSHHHHHQHHRQWEGFLSPVGTRLSSSWILCL